MQWQRPVPRCNVDAGCDAKLAGLERRARMEVQGGECTQPVCEREISLVVRFFHVDVVSPRKGRHSLGCAGRKLVVAALDEASSRSARGNGGSGVGGGRRTAG